MPVRVVTGCRLARCCHLESGPIVYWLGRRVLSAQDRDRYPVGSRLHASAPGMGRRRYERRSLRLDSSRKHEDSSWTLQRQEGYKPPIIGRVLGAERPPKSIAASSILARPAAVSSGNKHGPYPCLESSILSAATHWSHTLRRKCDIWPGTSRSPPTREINEDLGGALLT